MNKFLLLAGIAAFTFGTSSFTYAGDKHHAASHDENTEHYEAIEIDSVEQAHGILKDKTAKIAVILEKDTELEFLELEEIHEISYSLEAAIDYIRDHKAVDAAHVEAVDDAIQAVHHKSEDQEEAELREWFKKLNVALAEMESHR